MFSKTKVKKREQKKEWQKRLFEAARTGNLDLMEKCISNGADVNINEDLDYDDDDLTKLPLAVAIVHDQTATALDLIEGSFIGHLPAISLAIQQKKYKLARKLLLTIASDIRIHSDSDLQQFILDPIGSSMDSECLAIKNIIRAERDSIRKKVFKWIREGESLSAIDLEFLKQEPYLIQEKNKHVAIRSTLLGTAIYSGNVQLCDFLLEQGINVSVDDRFDAEKLKEISDNGMLIYLLIKQALKNKKADKRMAINRGSIFHNTDKETLKTSEAILSQTFMPDNAMSKYIKEKICEFSRVDILKPAFQVMALAALGHHDAGIHNKFNFKIFFLTEKINNLSHSGGYYNKRSSLFVTTSNQQKMIPYILHEGTHFVAHEVFKNSCYPYMRWDYLRRYEFDFIVYKTHLYFYQININKFPDDEKIVIQSFRTVFSDAYKEEDRPLELIVKVNETIGELGVIKGVAWLKQYTPHLLNYYIKVFNPACEKYLSDHRASQYLVDAMAINMENEPSPITLSI